MKIDRRQFLSGIGIASLLAGSSVLPGSSLWAADKPVHLRTIPISGEQIPSIGLGSWITFDVPPGEQQRRQRCFEVIQGFLQAGGRMIDSSPMYGYAQDLIGSALQLADTPDGTFSATKVWIPGASLGEAQMEQALDLWGLQQFDLVLVHNLVDWQSHLPWLQRWKSAGRVRYLGITTSHGRRHEDLVEVIRNQPFDFVQFTYNMADREAERRLLPLAREYGKAVVINRPFRGGDLFRRVAGRSLPGWAGELGCSHWAQFFLSWVISHSAVTCAIPATSNPQHLRQNMAVLRSPLPDEQQRQQMLEWFLAD
ncbi:MAG TPA: aldo/keto reductase [Xanthomonadales bacterium]|nr:aldo/keto reductase [Xanthomonadales bacterium]